MQWIRRAAALAMVFVTNGLPAAAQTAVTDTIPASITIANASARLTLSADGRIEELALQDGRELLAQPDARLMLLRIGGKWHDSSSLVVSREGDAYRLRVGFDGIAVTATAVIKPHGDYCAACLMRTEMN